MEKLELKHIIPYLPHKLKFELLDYKSDYVGEKYGICNGYYFLGGKVHYTFKDRSTAGKTACSCKPILHPIEDWEKNEKILDRLFIEFGGAFRTKKAFIHHKWLEFNMPLTELSYDGIQILFELHVDVFHLIGKGLAIDINTINK